MKVVESCRLSLTVDKFPWQPKNRSSEALKMRLRQDFIPNDFHALDVCTFMNPSLGYLMSPLDIFTQRSTVLLQPLSVLKTPA